MAEVILEIPDYKPNIANPSGEVWTRKYEEAQADKKIVPSWAKWMSPSYPDLYHYAKQNGPFKRIVDVGCGTGNKLRKLVRDEVAKEVVGIDIKPEHLILAMQQLERIDSSTKVVLKLGDATNLPEESRSADVITTSCVSCHLLDPQIEQAIAEKMRVIKPGGIIYDTEFAPQDECLDSECMYSEEGPHSEWHGQRIDLGSTNFTYHWDPKNPQMSPEYKTYEGMYNRLVDLTEMGKWYERYGIKLGLVADTPHPNQTDDPVEYRFRRLVSGIFRVPGPLQRQRSIFYFELNNNIRPEQLYTPPGYPLEAFVTRKREGDVLVGLGTPDQAEHYGQVAVCS